MSVTSMNDVTQVSHLPRPNVTKVSHFLKMSKFVQNRVEYVCYDINNVPTNFSDTAVTITCSHPFHFAESSPVNV